MKKTILFAAVAAMMGFTSCQDEVDMFEKAGKTATIDLNITNDLVMVTRSVTNVENANSWYIKVGKNDQCLVSALSSYAAGDYDITVSSHTNEAAAITANEAYYEGTVENQHLNKGSNPVTVPCGKAKNCRVKANFAGLAGFNEITNAKITVVSQTNATVTSMELDDNAKTKYCYAGSGKTINYKLTYNYNGSPKTINNLTITDPEAATEYVIAVGTNDNGTINLTITHDTEFTTDTDKTITIDAATGEEAK